MNKKRKRTNIRAENPKSTMAYFISHDEGIFPSGYTPLSKNEEIIKCANIMADLVSSMTIMLMKNEAKGDTRIKNALSKRLDVEPCRYMDRKNFIFKIVKDMILYGNSVVYPEVDGIELGYMKPFTAADCTFIADEKNEYKILYKGFFYEPNEVLHFVLVPKEDEPYKGEGYKKAIIGAVRTLVQANATKKGFLESKWKPSMVISVQADAEELRDKDLKKKILGSYTDTTEEGEPWLIPAGEIDVKTIQPLTLKDLAIQDSIELDKKAIATAIGIPPFMVGIGSFNKDEYNNLIATKVMSFAQIIQQQITRKAIVSPAMYVKMNNKSLMQYNLTEHMTYVKEMVGGGMMSRNEGRNDFDLAPAENDGMDDYIVLENYIPVDKVGEQKKLE